MTAMGQCIKKYSKMLITKAIIQRQSVLDSVKVQFLPHPFPEVFGRNGLDFGADHFKTTPPPPIFY